MKTNKDQRMKKTIKSLIEINNGIETLKKVKDVKFAFALMRNRKKIQRELDAYNESLDAFRLDDGENIIYKTYDAERIKLAEKYAKKDEKGKPVIENNNYILINESAFNADWEKLKSKEEYKAVLEKQKTLKEKADEGLAEEVEIDFYKIKEDVVPVELGLEDLEQIEDLIELK